MDRYSEETIDTACQEIAKRYATVFPGSECQLVAGVGFDRDCRGFIVTRNDRRHGSFLLSEELLQDETVDEILRRLKTIGFDELLQKDTSIVFGNRGIIE